MLLDDDALAALANRGLLRRARKDLESVVPEIAGEENGRLRVLLDGAVVSVTENTQASTCTCPAAGVCRHILAALIFLQESECRVAEPRECLDEILSVDDEMLRKWAGKAFLDRAKRRLAEGLCVQVEGSGPVLFTLPEENVTCRWMPGGGPIGMICSCHTPVICVHRVCAVLAFQVKWGSRAVELEEAALPESRGAVRTREKVLDSIGLALREMVSPGISRMSSSVEQRFRTLAVSAHSANLPRLERLLMALADEVVLILKRDAQADSRSLLTTAARAEALRCALAHPTPPLVGQHRTVYHRVGDLELIGMGARKWRSRSGYAGLTIYFWDCGAGNWAIWTDARPLSVQQLDAATRYVEEGPWEGCSSPKVASRSRLRLVSSWRNPDGRLSGRPETRVVETSAPDPSQTPIPVSHWSELVERAAAIFGEGFRDRREQDEIVFLAPARWGRRFFDEIRQEMNWAVYDAEGRELFMLLPNTAENAAALKALEAYKPDGSTRLLGVLRMQGDRIVVEPISFHGKSGVVNLTFDRTRKRSFPSRLGNPLATGDEDVAQTESLLEGSNTPLGLLLSALEDELEGTAEIGVRGVRDLTRLRNLAARADAVGLRSVSRSVARLLAGLQESAAVGSDSAGELLRAFHVLRVAAMQELILAAGERLAAIS